jgi:RNA polymerase sigma-70 factor (ECF subfamily)
MATIDTWLPQAYQLDEHALSEIYQALSPLLYRYAYRLLGNPADAEDIVAETFHRLLLALRHGNGPRQHLSAYLYRIAHNLITDRYRRHPLLDMPFDEALELSDALEANEDDSPEISAPIRIAQERARATLWQLTPDQRLVILLKYFEGQSNEEVAAALGKPIGAVKSLQHRALGALRRMLKSEQIGELV